MGVDANVSSLFDSMLNGADQSWLSSASSRLPRARGGIQPQTRATGTVQNSRGSRGRGRGGSRGTSRGRGRGRGGTIGDGVRGQSEPLKRTRRFPNLLPSMDGAANSSFLACYFQCVSKNPSACTFTIALCTEASMSKKSAVRLKEATTKQRPTLIKWCVGFCCLLGPLSQLFHSGTPNLYLLLQRQLLCLKPRTFVFLLPRCLMKKLSPRS